MTSGAQPNFKAKQAITSGKFELRDADIKPSRDYVLCEKWNRKILAFSQSFVISPA